MAEEQTGWRASIVLQPLRPPCSPAVHFWASTDPTLWAAMERDCTWRAQADLVSQRETADTGLRKDMFTSIINQFLNRTAEYR